ncbi:MAG: chemotaxis protein CheW [Thermoanaerobaculaceae bacterium]|jgi:purine-binding chemotaxis protein CheW
MRRLCTFYLDDMLFGIDVDAVQEVLRYQTMTPVPLAPTVVAGLINLRGQIVTALDLRRRLELPERPVGLLPTNVVLRSSAVGASLLVDSIGEVLEVDDESFEPPPETTQGITRELILGAYKLPDQLLLLLDLKKTLEIGTEVQA